MKKLNFSRTVDPLLDAYAQMLADQRDTTGLLIGMVYDNFGKVAVFGAVKQAELIIVSKQTNDCAYHAVSGFTPYLTAIQSSMFGEKIDCIVSTQTPGGTGALMVTLGVVKDTMDEGVLYIPNPTWDIHPMLGSKLGYEVRKYNYLDEVTKAVDENIVETFKRMKEGSVVLVQGVCHNPTGADLSLEQWNGIGGIAKERNLFLVIDLAYQGYGMGMWQDAECVRILQNLGLEFAIATSSSKNFGYYNRRLGAAHFCSKNASNRAIFKEAMVERLRWNVSTCAVFPAQVIATVFTDPDLNMLWNEELYFSRLRIQEMRRRFVEGMTERGFPEFGYILKQKGLFSYTGFTKEIALRLRLEYAIYIADNGSGRICMAGLNDSNIERVLDAIATVLK